ncbi:MAG: dihydrodipicolinate synthase family protein [Gammaproteobacteria bacterium]|nr:dihydrodipicolinate synthase family protein [Gammaproteobacteria bacterium]
MRFKGIYTPIITPFSSNGEIDWDLYAEVIDWQIENGVAGVIVGGSTGEFYALSKEERIQQFKFAAERINNRVEFMAGVNDIRVDECLDISMAAVDAGAKSLLVAAPPYSLPSEEELAHHVITIAKATELPIMLYNYPGRTGVEMGEDFLSIVAKNPLVAAIKESSGDYSRLPLLSNNYPSIELAVGGEEQVLEFAAWGAKSWVCATANFFPSECVQLMDILGKQSDFEKGRALMSAFMPLMQALEQGGKFLQCVKLGCEQQGRPGGKVRLPLLPIEDTLKKEMIRVIDTTRASLHAILK